MPYRSTRCPAECVYMMKVLIAAAALAAATLAAPVGARADTADDTFVAFAQSEGISASRADLIKAGHEVCSLIGQGPAGDGLTSPLALANAVMQEVPSIADTRVAGVLANGAVAVYCPPG
jgi:Protein of unknown function (DUF732)